jgi:putative transcriptional regulator
MMFEFGEPSILVATPQLRDPNFQKSVVLLAEHNDKGSLGFILNRPSDQPVRELITIDNKVIPPHLGAWYGGPVGQDHGIVLSCDTADIEATVIAPGIYLSATARCLGRLVDHAYKVRTARPRIGLAPDLTANDDTNLFHPYRFIVGYAGWSAEQLQDEIIMGAWVQLPLHTGLIFNTPWQQMWDEAMTHLGINASSLTSASHEYVN